MSDIWAKIERLAGQDIKTLSQQKVFTITEVSGGKVFFVPSEGNGGRRWGSKEVFEQIVRHDWARTDLRPVRVAEFYRETYNLDTQNSSYIAAILDKVMTL